MRPIQFFPVLLMILCLAACAPTGPALPPAAPTPTLTLPTLPPTWTAVPVQAAATDSPTATANPTATAAAVRPPGEKLRRTPPVSGLVEEYGLLPPTVDQPAQLLVSGQLPTACHTPQAHVQPPDDKNRLMVTLRAEQPAGQMCTQALEPYSLRISLGKLPAGTYEVFLNGQSMGKVVIP